jgi:hypothetical protein
VVCRRSPTSRPEDAESPRYPKTQRDLHRPSRGTQRTPDSPPKFIFRTLVRVRAELSQWFFEHPRRLRRRAQKAPVTRRCREAPHDLAGARRKPPIPHTILFSRFSCGCGQNSASGFSNILDVSTGGRYPKAQRDPNALAGARREPPISHTNFPDSRAGAGRTQPWCGGGGFSKILNVSAGGRRKSPLPEDTERPPTPQPWRAENPLYGLARNLGMCN